jgi:outer membrane protein assembly factor BamB
VVRVFAPAERWPRWVVRVGQDRLNRPLRLGQQIFVTDARGNLAVLRKRHLRFRLRLDRGPLGPPGALPPPPGGPDRTGSVPPPGLVLAGTSSGRVWAVTPAGKVRWIYSGPAGVRGTPRALGDVAVVAAGRQLLGVDLSGNQAWSRDLVGGATSGPVVVGDRVVAGDGLGHLLAVDAAGKVRWRRDLGAGVVHLAARAGGRTLVASCADGRVHVLSAAGERLLLATPPVPVARALLSGRGRAYLLGDQGVVMRLDLGSGGGLRRLLDLSTSTSGAAASADGGALLATGSGELLLVSPSP